MSLAINVNDCSIPVRLRALLQNAQKNLGDSNPQIGPISLREARGCGRLSPSDEAEALGYLRQNATDGFDTCPAGANAPKPSTPGASPGLTLHQRLIAQLNLRGGSKLGLEDVAPVVGFLAKGDVTDAMSAQEIQNVLAPYFQPAAMGEVSRRLTASIRTMGDVMRFDLPTKGMSDGGFGSMGDGGGECYEIGETCIDGNGHSTQGPVADGKPPGPG